MGSCFIHCYSLDIYKPTYSLQEPAPNLQKTVLKGKLILQQPTHYFVKTQTH